MAYVIAVCGAGGKTTKLFSLADEYAKLGYSVAVTTTTHMWVEDNFLEISDIKENPQKYKVYPITKRNGEKATILSKDEYDKVCSLYDIVIIEADGSHCMPLKIPRITTEPVIPSNVNEIVVVYGLQSIDRKIKNVCHRYAELNNKLNELNGITGDTIVTEDIIKQFYEQFYKKPLQEKYQNAKISLYIADMTKNDNYKQYKKIVLVLCASGKSSRFGENKLLYKINNIPIYQNTLSKIVKAKNKLINILKNKYDYDIQIDISIISSYEDILNDNSYNTKNIKNNISENGLSSCMKIAIDKFDNYDAIGFFNADMPMLDDDEVYKMIYYYMFSNKTLASMYVLKEMHNPAIFDKKWYDKIYQVEGDKGPRQIVVDNPRECYRYHTYEEHLMDIDTKNDLNKIIK